MLLSVTLTVLVITILFGVSDVKKIHRHLKTDDDIRLYTDALNFQNILESGICFLYFLMIARETFLSYNFAVCVTIIAVCLSRLHIIEKQNWALQHNVTDMYEESHLPASLIWVYYAVTLGIMVLSFLVDTMTVQDVVLSLVTGTIGVMGVFLSSEDYVKRLCRRLEK